MRASVTKACYRQVLRRLVGGVYMFGMFGGCFGERTQRLLALAKVSLPLVFRFHTLLLFCFSGCGDGGGAYWHILRGARGTRGFVLCYHVC